jgi:hypothetical protein
MISPPRSTSRERRRLPVRSLSLRPLLASVLPAVAVSLSWVRIEQPRLTRDVVAVALLALAPAVFPRVWQRVVAAVAASAGAAWIAFGIQAWEALPFRDERVVAPALRELDHGIADFYRVLLPFDPTRTPEMHTVLLCVVFWFVLTAVILAAAERPLAAAAVTVVGAGWPATLLGGDGVLIGALALAAALSIPLFLRVRSGPAFVAGVATAAAVVAGAAWTSSATAVASNPAIDWESWDFQVSTQATAVTFAWDANYDGVRFPAHKTVVLTVDGPDRPRYWRASTLDLFTGDHWFESLRRLGLEAGDGRPMRLDPLTPPRAARRESWLEQRIEVKALVDDHLVAAGTPMAIDARQLRPVSRLSGGVLRAWRPLEEGQRYRVWSYDPDPSPAALAASKARYPGAAQRYLRLEGRTFPAFRARGREADVASIFADPSYPDFAQYEEMYATARRVAGSRGTPYAAVLALESWLRSGGGFRYDELPPASFGAPLVSFVTQTKAGYCQHFAGAMAVMLRMLGIPARVAVGFTSGTFHDGRWVVTDHEAHAWVEVWFAGHGWVPFDPTPGRGTFGGTYSFASDSEAAVELLKRGELSDLTAPDEGPRPERADLAAAAPTEGGDRGLSLLQVAVLLGTLWLLAIGAGKAVAQRLRYATSDPRRAATASRRELEAFLRDQGIFVPPSATLDDLRLAVRRDLGLDAGPFAEAAAQARFGPPDAARRFARLARRELRTLLELARNELSLRERARGYLSLRSLRAGWRT